MELSDLESFDAYTCQVLADLRNNGATMSNVEFEHGVIQTFTTVLSSGAEVELCPGGTLRQVKKSDIEEFIALVIQARFSEAKQQIRAIQDGIDTVLMGNFGHIQYLTAQQIENRVCGTKTIDTERLKSVTKYSNCGEDHEIVQRFWRVFESFS
mmetsp:Transcript_43568/g.57692  ORF Transcript_43568/g.57692 Transcript_43568/m.57692 type:complete len:154 (-) Transcript_43568:354-815(-)